MRRLIACAGPSVALLLLLGLAGLLRFNLFN
jgi:hypothetical protein